MGPSAPASENPYLNGPPPKKRRIPFLNEMLLNMPDARKYSNLPSDQEAKLESFLEHLRPIHKEQRSRLFHRHATEYKEWIENSEQQIDDQVYAIHFSPSTFLLDGKEALMLEASKELITSEISKEALSRLPMEKRSVLVNKDQLVEMGKNQSPPTEIGKGELNNVEFASYFGDVGVVMRRRMCEEEMEMRMFQAKEREMVMTFLTRLNYEKYGSGVKGGGGEGTSTGSYTKPALKSAVTMPAGGSISSMGDPRRVFTAEMSKLGGNQQGKATHPRPPNITIPSRATDPRLNKGQGGGSTVTTSPTVITPRTAAPQTGGTPNTSGLPPQSSHSYFPAPTAPVPPTAAAAFTSSHSLTDSSTGNNTSYSNINASINANKQPNRSSNSSNNPLLNLNSNQNQNPISMSSNNPQYNHPSRPSSRRPSQAISPRDKDTHMTGTGSTTGLVGDQTNINRGSNNDKNNSINSNSPLFFTSPLHNSRKNSTESPLIASVSTAGFPGRSPYGSPRDGEDIAMVNSPREIGNEK